jgi:hypothetical protein
LGNYQELRREVLKNVLLKEMLLGVRGTCREATPSVELLLRALDLEVVGGGTDIVGKEEKMEEEEEEEDEGEEEEEEEGEEEEGVCLLRPPGKTCSFLVAFSHAPSLSLALQKALIDIYLHDQGRSDKSNAAYVRFLNRFWSQVEKQATTIATTLTQNAIAAFPFPLSAPLESLNGLRRALLTNVTLKTAFLQVRGSVGRSSWETVPTQSVLLRALRLEVVDGGKEIVAKEEREGEGEGGESGGGGGGGRQGETAMIVVEEEEVGSSQALSPLLQQLEIMLKEYRRTAGRVSKATHDRINEVLRLVHAHNEQMEHFMRETVPLVDLSEKKARRDLAMWVCRLVGEGAF